MKAALLIAGYLRSFRLNIPNLQKNVIAKFDGVDIYIHITKGESKQDKYDNKIDELKELEYIEKTLKPKTILVDDDHYFWGDPKKNSLLNMWSKYHKLNTLKQQHEYYAGDYDIVIKYRPDTNIESGDIFDKEIDPKTLYIPSESIVDRSKLLKADDKALCDIFAYGSSLVMDQYFALFSCIEEMTDKYGVVPETVLYHYVENFCKPYKLVDIKYSVILSTCNVFAICGDSGSGKSTLDKRLKTLFGSSFSLECDRYHKWERGDKNWESATHLNPESNFLSKMEKDIFDLKVGKDVYQVDYDHKTGKFTDQQTINSSDNIIVCGLHSLYSENHGVYNLKIFMDTDEKLKTLWKVKRDTVERGYTVQKVLEQIKTRRADYEKYILPQKELADIIIKFYSDDDFSPEDLKANPSVKLRIIIKHNPTVTKFTRNPTIKANCDIEHVGDFVVFSFDSYKKPDLLPVESGDYYDYILYFILNLK